MVSSHYKLIRMKRFFVAFAFLTQSIAYAQNHSQEVYPDSSNSIINLSDLLEQIGTDNEKIRRLHEQTLDTQQIKSFRESITNLESAFKKVKEQSDFFLQSYSRPWLIENLNVKWIRINDDWLDLSGRISRATENNEKGLRDIRALRFEWEKNKIKIVKDSIGTFLDKPISELVTNLSLAEDSLQKKIKTYLKFQERIALARAEIDHYLERLEPLRNQDFVTFFQQDEPLLWRRSATHFDAPVTKSFQFASQDIIEYMEISIGKLIFILAMGIAFLILLTKNYKRSLTEDGKQNNQFSQNNISSQFLFTSAYTVTLLFSLLILTNRPPLLTELLLLLFTFPLIVFGVRRSSGIIKVVTISFIILYWITFLEGLFLINTGVRSYIDLTNTIAASLLLFVLYKNRKLLKSQFPRLNDFFIRTLLPVLMILTMISIVLQLAGYTRLALALTNGSINFIYLGPVIIICSIIFQDLFQMMQHSTFVKYSHLAKDYYYLIFKIIKLGSFYLIFITFLASFSLTTLFKTAWQQIWNFGGQFGEFNITVGDVLEFFSIIFVSWLISAILRVLLTDEILSRTNLRRGVPMAIGVIVRYIIIFLGFILAIAYTGFDLTKISILAGGLGVGIGFGLQHLVANFIAGLILIFERPIIVGDTVESEQIEGEVKEIGIRASKIQTFDGAEVIIPNSNLINSKLSNWTLSHRERREHIVVRTSVKANPENVIEILNRVMRQHANILTTPEPFVLFEGQLDQSLQFKIYYWLVSDIFKTRCEINIQIYRELKEIGVELPIPIHEIKNKID